MRIERHGDTVQLWLDADDTYRWAHKPGDLWPCSYLSGKMLYAEFHNGDLVDCRVDCRHDEAFDIGSDEFNAITNNFLNLKAA